MTKNSCKREVETVVNEAIYKYDVRALLSVASLKRVLHGFSSNYPDLESSSLDECLKQCPEKVTAPRL